MEVIWGRDVFLGGCGTCTLIDLLCNDYMKILLIGLMTYSPCNSWLPNLNLCKGTNMTKCTAQLLNCSMPLPLAQSDTDDITWTKEAAGAWWWHRMPHCWSLDIWGWHHWGAWLLGERLLLLILSLFMDIKLFKKWFQVHCAFCRVCSLTKTTARQLKLVGSYCCMQLMHVVLVGE